MLIIEIFERTIAIIAIAIVVAFFKAIAKSEGKCNSIAKRIKSNR